MGSRKFDVKKQRNIGILAAKLKSNEITHIDLQKELLSHGISYSLRQISRFLSGRILPPDTVYLVIYYLAGDSC